MPAIQVARTDTFEQQRQKINQIGSAVFNISAGGSDLSTGNLKLGDGSISAPSLNFSSDAQLGIYKSNQSTLGFVSRNKKIFDVSDGEITNYRNHIFVKKSLKTSGVSISNVGQNYDAGSFLDINLLGGTGDGGKVDITITSHIGTFSSGIGYNSGSYSNILLSGGSGSGASLSFNVSSLQVSVSNNGSGYVTGNYPNVTLSGGSGNGAKATINIAQDGSIFGVNITSSGSGYSLNDILTFSAADVGGSGSGGQLTVTTIPGIISNTTFASKGSGYQIGNVLSLPGVKTGVTANLKGEVSGVTTTLSNSSAVITVSSTTGIVAGMTVTKTGGSGQLGQGTTTVLSVDSNTQITLSLTPQTSGSVTLTFASSGQLNEIVVSNTSGIFTGSIVSQTSGTGTLGSGVTVTNVNSFANIITLSSNPQVAGTSTLTFTPPFGVGTTQLQYTVTSVGSLDSISISDPGNGYSVGDILTVNTFELVTPIEYTVSSLSVQVVSLPSGISLASSGLTVGSTIEDSAAQQPQAKTIKKIVTNQSGNILYLEVEGGNFTTSSILVKTGTSSPTFAVSNASNKNAYVINDGTNSLYTPNLTLYPNNKYKFTYPSGHPFGLSESPDGTHYTITKTTTLSTSSRTVTVSSTAGISVGMTVVASQGSTGTLPSSVIVESFNSSNNTITLSKNPISSGSATLTFTGVEYTSGVTRNSTSNFIIFTVPENISTLYYYCSIHPNMAGEDGNESVITINPTNPKVFGSNLSLLVTDIDSSNTIFTDVINGSIESFALTAEDINSDTITNTGQISTSSTVTNSITTNQILSSGSLTISPVTTFSNDLKVSTKVTITSSSGNFVTSGNLKTLATLNVNDKLLITDSNISSIGANDITLSPSGSRITKIVGTSAVVIPSGTTLDRPSQPLAQNGAIRFNTDSNQYEGYNSTTTSWSSLGGVRDIDGNTYIVAELTAGANDNTLWFYNDSNNTLSLNTQFFDFKSVKKISSSRLGLPPFSVWQANTPVSIGQYLKYRNNLYEVTASGTTASAGNEPTHSSGVTNNGTAQLTWYSLAVSPLEFTEIEELRIGPNKDCPLVVNAEIKLANNTISTLVNDLIINPNAGKKVVINSTTHFGIPVGNSNQRSTATAQAGSIRYNTTISQFEGYSGTNWSSLGGVRDVDGNTYIIPETLPGANENILYFYNDNLNTLQLTKTTLDFTSIDTITTSGLANLALDTPLVTLNLEDTTIDNRDSTRTFISTSKQYLDLGLSSGLVVDPVLRLDDQGDVYLNTTFGSGTFTGVKVLDGQLKEFELADYAIRTASFSLVKGTSNSNAVILYDRDIAKGSQVTVICKSSTGKKSIASFNVIDNGTDIFYSEFGGLNSVSDIFTSAFDMTPDGETRITVSLTNLIANAETVQFTVTTQVYK